jgi:hypothetical protein
VKQRAYRKRKYKGNLAKYQEDSMKRMRKMRKKRKEETVEQKNLLEDPTDHDP